MRAPLVRRLVNLEIRKQAQRAPRKSRFPEWLIEEWQARNIQIDDHVLRLDSEEVCICPERCYMNRGLCRRLKRLKVRITPSAQPLRSSWTKFRRPATGSWRATGALGSPDVVCLAPARSQAGPQSPTAESLLWPDHAYYDVLNPCPFCAVGRDRIMIDTEHAVAFLDRFPVTKGHTLVVPRRHVASFYDLSPTEQDDLWHLVGLVREQIVVLLAPDGLNVGLNDGLAAGQTVMHAHLHVIPRWVGDVPDPRGGVRWVVANKAPYWND